MWFNPYSTNSISIEEMQAAYWQLWSEVTEAQFKWWTSMMAANYAMTETPKRRIKSGDEALHSVADVRPLNTKQRVAMVGAWS